MRATTKRGKSRSDSARSAKSRGKSDASAREEKRTQASQAARSCSCAIANDAAAEAIVRRPRMDPAEAFREYGVDEHKVAETYAHMINTLSASIKEGAVQKLLLDALKEVMRVLESKRANDRAGDRGGARRARGRSARNEFAGARIFRAGDVRDRRSRGRIARGGRFRRGTLNV